MILSTSIPIEARSRSPVGKERFSYKNVTTWRTRTRTRRRRGGGKKDEEEDKDEDEDEDRLT